MTTAEKEFQSFADEHVRTIEPIYKDWCEASWQANLTGSEEDNARAAQMETNFRQVYSSAENLKRLQGWEASAEVNDRHLKRQLIVLINTHLANQMDPQLMEKIVGMQQEVERTFATHRAEVDGKKLSDNEIREILRRSDDNKERQAAWEGSKKIGEAVADRVLELAHLRNQVAKNLGFDNFYTMQLSLQELTENQLFGICKRFEDLSDEPFRELRQGMDERLASRFGVKPEDLRPWHYVDPFFQEAPVVERISLDPFFEDKDLRELTERFYTGIGLSVDDILARSDLFERPGKNQHAFCIDIDRKGDIRVLCNIRPTTRWMGTMLHEFGHAVYDKYVNPDLPFLLRTASHTFTTEAVAMLMGRQCQEATWLREMLSLPPDDVRRVGSVARNQLRSEMLVSTRWMLTMIHFERELYRNPEQNLSKLWWDFVEEFQMLRRPEGREAPDWASKIHVSCYPVYYHNYLLGEFMASQLRHWIDTKVLPPGTDTLGGLPEVGGFLREKIFAPGTSLRWDELLQSATGEGLNPEYFVEEFVKAPTP